MNRFKRTRPQIVDATNDEQGLTQLGEHERLEEHTAPGSHALQRLVQERESLRNTLLASISHDLRTPLAVMAGAGSTLAERGATLDEATRVSLARSIEVKAREMSELVSNVLDLMRFESGQVILDLRVITERHLGRSLRRRLGRAGVTATVASRWLPRPPGESSRNQARSPSLCRIIHDAGATTPR